MSVEGPLVQYIGQPGSGRWQITLSGDTDVSAQAMLHDILATVAGAEPADAVVDLAAVQFMGSHGLSFLAGLRNLVSPAGKTVTLHCPNMLTRRTLEVVGFDRVFHITPEE